MEEVIPSVEDSGEVSSFELTCCAGDPRGLWGGGRMLRERRDEDWNASVQLRVKGNQPNAMCSCDLTQLGQF